MKRLHLLLILLGLSYFSYSGIADTVSIYSNAMKTNLNTIIITPDEYSSTNNNYPVVYLLHGLGGDYANWLRRVPAIKDYADQYKMIIVCPDGRNSWYFDHPTDTSSRFETFITKEVVEYTDKHYRTIPARNGRAITGLSMGGHGGLYLGMRNTAQFSACGSMSGAVDLKRFSQRWEIDKFLGDSSSNISWENYTVMYLIENKLKDSIAILIDCGIKDFFYETNKILHEKMLSLNIPHDYIERPGSHDWDYWRNAIEYQLLFFRRHFDSALNTKAN